MCTYGITCSNRVDIPGNLGFFKYNHLSGDVEDACFANRVSLTEE